MNSLSWLIYLADVVPSLGNILGGAGVIGTFCFVSWFILWGIALTSDEGDEIANAIKRNTWVWYATILLTSCLFVSALIPSKETIYLIAGSEAGGIVATSERGQEIFDKINLIIDAQLDELLETE